MSFLVLPCLFVIILRLCSFLSLPRPPDAILLGFFLYPISILACLPLRYVFRYTFFLCTHRLIVIFPSLPP
ncbi:hypothetical protein JB92DRAFT_2932704, partial [Gautieria morchelliformis]